MKTKIRKLVGPQEGYIIKEERDAIYRKYKKAGYQGLKKFIDIVAGEKYYMVSWKKYPLKIEEHLNRLSHQASPGQ